MSRSCRWPFPLAACNIDVQKHESDGKADVDITTPVGNVSVRTNVGAADTGLAVYPGARPLEDENEPKNANVNVGNSMFGVKVVAAKYESNDAQDRIIDFYRNELKPYRRSRRVPWQRQLPQGSPGVPRETLRRRSPVGRRPGKQSAHRLGEITRRRNGVRSRPRADQGNELRLGHSPRLSSGYALVSGASNACS